MKITAVTTTLLTGPSTNDRFLREARRLRSAAFIEIHTDAGVTGIGETYAGYFCPEAIPSIVDFFAPILIGADAPVEELWQRMYRCGSGSSPRSPAFRKVCRPRPVRTRWHLKQSGRRNARCIAADASCFARPSPALWAPSPKGRWWVFSGSARSPAREKIPCSSHR